MLQQWPLVTSTPEQGRVCWDKLHCSHLPSLLLVQLRFPCARRMSKPHPQPAPPSTWWTCPCQTCSASSLCPCSSSATCCWEFILQNLEATGEPQNLPELPPLLSFWARLILELRLHRAGPLARPAMNTKGTGTPVRLTPYRRSTSQLQMPSAWLGARLGKVTLH